MSAQPIHNKGASASPRVWGAASSVSLNRVVGALWRTDHLFSTDPNQYEL
jgi:hypothetical protein